MARAARTPESMAFSRRLRRLLMLRGMSVADFGEAMGISPKSIYHWTGGDWMPHVDTVRLMCRALSCTWADLLGEVDE